MQDNGRKFSEADDSAERKACEKHREYLAEFTTHAEAAVKVLENSLPKDIRVTVIFRRDTGDTDPNTASAMLFTNDIPPKLLAIMEFLKRGMCQAKEG